ncbi:hypothetical protein HK103_001982 [Boothiomyces macroporosus]|uniref:Uncharacterized protein n=1 Tax=Boothiomyces macroporosus TaxID=261099 RepID=A0AAD5Y501_9FUNG|nr:hypothetical protein HK103_001982 [Boothiomyces macroporosus]
MGFWALVVSFLADIVEAQSSAKDCAFSNSINIVSQGFNIDHSCMDHYLLFGNGKDFCALKSGALLNYTVAPDHFSNCGYSVNCYKNPDCSGTFGSLDIPGNQLQIPQWTTSLPSPTATTVSSPSDGSSKVLIIALIVSAICVALLSVLGWCLYSKRKWDKLEKKFQAVIVKNPPISTPINTDQALSPSNTLVGSHDNLANKKDTDLDILRTKINLSVSDFSRDLISTPTTVMRTASVEFNASRDFEIRDHDQRIQSKLHEYQLPEIHQTLDPTARTTLTNRNSDIVMPPKLGLKL